MRSQCAIQSSAPTTRFHGRSSTSRRGRPRRRDLRSSSARAAASLSQSRMSMEPTGCRRRRERGRRVSPARAFCSRKARCAARVDRRVSRLPGLSRQRATKSKAASKACDETCAICSKARPLVNRSTPERGRFQLVSRLRPCQQSADFVRPAQGDRRAIAVWPICIRLAAHPPFPWPQRP